MKTREELGQELIALVSKPLDGAQGNMTLAERSLALLEQGAALEARDAEGMTPLMWAARHYRRKIFNAVMEHNPDLLAVDNAGMTALDHAKKKKQKLAIPVLEKAFAKAAWDEELGHSFATKSAVKTKKPASFRKARAAPARTV